MRSELRQAVAGKASAAHDAVKTRDTRMPETDRRAFPRIGADLVELIAWLEESLAEAWREINDLRGKVSALSPPAGPITVEQLAQRHTALTPGGIRWMLFHRETNGLQQSGAVIARGRRLYLDEVRFLDWFASTNKPQGRSRPGQRRR